MKKYLLLLLFTYTIHSSLDAQNRLSLLDPLEAIYPDKNDSIKLSTHYSIDVPLNSFATVHVLVKTSFGEKIAIKAYQNEKKIPQEFWSKLIAVPVEQNTGLDSRTIVYTGKDNPHVVRKAPFDIFEIIKPLKSEEIVATNNYSAYRLSMPVNYLKNNSSEKITIVAKSENWEESGTFDISIHPIEIPKLEDGKFFYTNWFNLNRMEEAFQLERWSDSWFDMLQKHAKLMAHGRQNAAIIPHELISYTEGQISLDKNKLLRYIHTFQKEGIQYFETPHLMYRGDDDNWSTKELKVVLTKKGFYSEQGKKEVAEIVRLLRDFARENNLSDKLLLHVQDEPTRTQSKCYREVVQLVKSIYPEINIMDATNDKEGLEGAIDYWCPLINDFQENQLFFEKRTEKGDKVLLYTCLVPGGKWLNRTLDMEKLRQVYFGWGAARFNTFGYLHWGLNQYQANPYTHSVVQHPSPGAGSNNFLPAGDTHIIYPSLDGPLSSLRFEAHRIGVEDFELLHMLKKDKPKLAQKLILELFRDYTDYELSIEKYRIVKKYLLQSFGN